MTSTSLLIFDLDGERFGVDVCHVRESVWLPELAPAEELPAWFIGLFSLRGTIVPVADLRLRFGHPARTGAPSDRVVVLNTEAGPLGLIASDVLEVFELPPGALQVTSGLGATSRLISAEAWVREELLPVLDVGNLASLSGLSEEFPQQPLPLPASSPNERSLFHARAMALRLAVGGEEGQRQGLAVIGIGGERFGVDLAAIREFKDIVQIHPIPCCPTHILGAINLRGELVTLLDVRSALHLTTSGSCGNKALIGTLGDQAVAVAVDDIDDVTYLPAGDLKPPPSLLLEHHGSEIIGSVEYAGQVMAVLDLHALLARQDWIVEENV